MAVRKVKGSWWVDFQINFTRYRKRSPLNSKAGAEAFEVQMRQALAEKGNLDHLLRPEKVTKPTTYAEFAEKWMRAYVAVNNKPSEQRAKRYIVKSGLIPIFGNKVLSEIKTADIEAYKAREQSNGISAKTINNRLTVLRKSLVTAIEWEELESLPKFRLLKTQPFKFRHLRESDVQSIINSCKTRNERAMVLIAVRTGIRFSELCALEWGDIDGELRLLSVRRSVVHKHVGTPKNGRVRYVPLTNDALKELESLNPSHKSAPIFQFNGERYLYWNALCFLHRACDRAGIERIGWHTLRHTFASQLASKGASLKAIQDLLGHSTINMTLRYAHLAPEVLRDTIALLESKKIDDSNSMSICRQPETIKSPEGVETLLREIFVSPPR